MEFLGSSGEKRGIRDDGERGERATQARHIPGLDAKWTRRKFERYQNYVEAGMISV